jgi:hypothetical protein
MARLTSLCVLLIANICSTQALGAAELGLDNFDEALKVFDLISKNAINL